MDYLNIDELNEQELMELINDASIREIEMQGSNLMDIFLID